jgi:hypothetical protein
LDKRRGPRCNLTGQPVRLAQRQPAIAVFDKLRHRVAVAADAEQREDNQDDRKREDNPQEQLHA